MTLPRPPSGTMRPVRLGPAFAAALLSACTTLPPAPGAVTIPADCTALAAALEAGALGSPSVPRPLPGWPGLAADRFLAAFAPPAPGTPAARAWLDRLAAAGRDLDDWRVARLPADGLAPPLAPRATLPARLDACRTASRTAAGRDASALGRVHADAQVPSEYSDGARVLGIWPLTVLPVQALGARYRQETLARFADPPPPRGTRLRYAPPPAPPAAAVELHRDALDMPVPTAAQLDALYAAYAPVFAIDTAGADDRPGRPLRRADGRLDFVPEPVVYRYAGYGFLHGRPVLQLHWLIWFAARPPADGTLYAGALDGVLWRVTLDAQQQPYVYDTVHACGCYHLVFPRPGLHLSAAAAALAETPLVPHTVAIAPPARVRVTLAAGTHYVSAVGTDDGAPAEPYRSADYTALYAAGGAQTLFGPDGLIAGSERPERWLLWPMGVASAGAMRERGRHAIAFVGERHFDDPGLPADWLEDDPR